MILPHGQVARLGERVTEIAGETGVLKVVGAAGLMAEQDDARAAIREGRMDATIAQNPRAMGRLALVAAQRLLKGETLAPEQPVAIELVSRQNVGAATPQPVQRTKPGPG